ncbi:MAG: PqqD family peptide modification chaperone [Candidatus Heimdallarchaeaceae archaeon]
MMDLAELLSRLGIVRKSTMSHQRNLDTTARMHLRKEKKGKSLLLVNATMIFHLNKTATDFASRIIDGKDDTEIIREMKRKYHVSEEQLKSDLDDLRNSITRLMDEPDIDPVQHLSQDISPLLEAPFSAPLRMDLALTYRCNNKCTKCYVENYRDVKELSTVEWKKVLDNLWNLGIPHVTFTGGEPTLRPDLPELVEYAEDLGIITGLISNGRKLKNKKLVNNLIAAGIDHFQITIESHDASVHDSLSGERGAWKETVEGIKNIVPTPVYIMTNTTLTPYNVKDIEKTVEFLHSIGIEQFAANSIIKSGGGKQEEMALTIEELDEAITKIMNKANELGMKFLWYSPTRYCDFNPIEKGLGMKQCSAAHIAMAIEPDGEVIPCQSYFEPLGNILTTRWRKIWKHKTAKKLRNMKYLQEECIDCPEREICGGGCPLNYAAPMNICKTPFS